MAGRWVDVGEAARDLGISTDAVRKRIARGSLESDRPNGNVLVWLDDSGMEAGREAQVDGGPLVESLRDQVAYLREMIAARDEEIRRRDVIISQLTHPQEPPGATERPGEVLDRAEPIPGILRGAHSQLGGGGSSGDEC